MKKIIKALVLALCVALAVCAFAVAASAAAPAGSTVEVTVDGNTTYYNNFDNAWAAARAGAGAATVKLIGNASFSGYNDVDDGSNAEDITLDLNGYTLDTYQSNSYPAAFRVLTHGSKFKVCDTSENGGGTINASGRFLTLGDYAWRSACPYWENHGNNPDFVFSNSNNAIIEIDNVTITSNVANSGDGRAAIWAWILCADIDITNSTINVPNAGMLYIEDNMTLVSHTLFIDVADTEINTNTFVVEMLQGNGTAATNMYLQENLTWNFENCDINSNGVGNGYVFYYDVAWGNNFYNYLPSYTNLVNQPTSGSNSIYDYAVPSNYAPKIYLDNCTVETNGNGLVATRSTAANIASVYIAGGSYKIDMDGTPNGDNFINRGAGIQWSQRATLSTYFDGEKTIYPEFNFNPAEITTTTYGGIYVATSYKAGTSGGYIIDRTPYLYDVVADSGMYKLVDRTIVDGMLYNLSLANKMGINLAIPAAEWEKVTVALEGATLTSNLTNIGGSDYYLVSFEGINAVSTTKVYSFVITETASGATQTVDLSVLGYATDVLAGAYTAAEQELARAILQYALEAEKYADLNADAIDALEAALDGTNKPANATEFAGDIDTTALGATVLYGAAIDFSGNAPAFEITLDNDYVGEDVVVTVTYKDLYGQTVTNVLTLNATTKSARIEGMKAYDFDNTLTITIAGVDGEFTYNLATFLNDFVALEDGAYADFANAIYNYVNAAQAYQDARQ